MTKILPSDVALFTPYTIKMTHILVQARSLWHFVQQKCGTRILNMFYLLVYYDGALLFHLIYDSPWYR